MTDAELKAQEIYLATQRVRLRAMSAATPLMQRLGIETGQACYIQNRFILGGGALLAWMMLRSMTR